MTFALVSQIQKALNKRGENLVVDGVWGPKTSAAVIRFKKSVGLKARDYVGPITRSVLFGEKKKKPVNSTEPSWLQKARQEVGVREIKGYKHNAAILEYWVKSKLGFTTDETPWCAGFVGAMLEDVGLRSTRSGMARSYLRWGKPLKRPVTGCVVVFWRDSRGGTSGHVGFVTGVDQRGNLLVLGGNQSDAVNVKPFSKDRVLGYRWPEAVPINDNLIASVSYEETSSNEA